MYSFLFEIARSKILYDVATSPATADFNDRKVKVSPSKGQVNACELEHVISNCFGTISTDFGYRGGDSVRAAASWMVVRYVMPDETPSNALRSFFVFVTYRKSLTETSKFICSGVPGDSMISEAETLIRKAKKKILRWLVQLSKLLALHCACTQEVRSLVLKHPTPVADTYDRIDRCL